MSLIPGGRGGEVRAPQPGERRDRHADLVLKRTLHQFVKIIIIIIITIIWKKFLAV